MSSCTNNGGCNCSHEEVQALICELLDHCSCSDRAREIRARLAECTACHEHLEHEEYIRSMVRNCCGGDRAPEHLRERISFQIRMTQVEVRYNG